MRGVTSEIRPVSEDHSPSIKGLRSLADYVQAARRICRDISSGNKGSSRTVRVALASSFTLPGMKDIMLVTCAEAGIHAHIYESRYNEYWQDLLNPNSPLYRHDPDVIVIFIDVRDLLGEWVFTPYQASDNERREWVDAQADRIRALVETAKLHTRSKLLIHNFEVPVYSPLGILEDKQPFGVREAIETLNGRLREVAKGDSQVFVFNYDLFCSVRGKAGLVDRTMYYLGDARLQWSHLPALSRQYLSFIRPLVPMIRKCIVLDLDNTLWGGIIGEDGLEGIKLGPTPEGRPYWEFQKLLLALYQRGVILAVNSKNNPDDALRVMREHPFMVLREKHFAAMRINWHDKAENMLELADELRLGLDSLVFLDDDRANIARLRVALPDVLVVELPDDPAFYTTTLMELGVFNSLQLTEEDKIKGRLYAEQRKRRELHREGVTVEEHLASLGTVVTIQRAKAFTIPRIAQLAQKTNQFNMTTRRHLEEDIRGFAEAPTCHVLCCRVQDTFGDSGITGVVIAHQGDHEWRIDTFLLSCRVIGRGVEDALLSYVIDMARSREAKRVVGEFIPTAKNAPAKDFYGKKGFVLEQTDGPVELWVYDVSNPCPIPGYVTVRVEP